MRGTLVIALLSVAGCALFGTKTTKESRPKAPTTAEEAASTEEVAFAAEREINAAEEALKGLKPDEGDAALTRARRLLDDPRFKSYPDAALLEDRYGELLAKVPRVRQEVARRELEAKVMAAREQIGVANASLIEAIKGIRKADPDDPDFKLADESVEALQKAIDDNQDLEHEDRKYGKDVLEVRKKLSKHKKTIESRRLTVHVRRARGLISDAMKELDVAIRQIAGKRAQKVDFNQAKSAIEETDKVIKRNDDLVTKDLKYGRWVQSVKKRLSSKRDLVARREQEVSIRDQKALVEATKRELKSALRKISVRVAAEPDFKEAEGAVDALEKAIAEGNDLATKSGVYARYSTAATKTAIAAKKQIGQRRVQVKVEDAKAEIEANRSLVKEALGVLKRSPGPGDFEAAKGAIDKTKKALDSAIDLATKDRGFAKYIAATRRSMNDASGRVDDLEQKQKIDEQKARVSVALDALKGAVRPLSTFSPTDEHFAAANSAIADAEKALGAGAELESKSSYAKFAVAARKRIRDTAQKVEKRQDELKIRAQTLLVEDAMTTLQLSLKQAKSTQSEQALQDAQASHAAASEELNKGVELETKNKKYRSFAKRSREKLKKAKADLEETESTIAFRAGPVSDLREGLELARSAKKAEPVDAQKNYSEALQRFSRCADKGGSVLASYPRLAKKTFVVAKKRSDARGLLDRCRKAKVSAQKDQASVKALVAVHEGPIKGLVGARVLLEETQYKKALSSFERCVSEGKTLSHKHTKLKKQKFSVDGEKMTIDGIVKACKKGASSARRAIAMTKK